MSITHELSRWISRVVLLVYLQALIAAVYMMLMLIGNKVRKWLVERGG